MNALDDRDKKELLRIARATLREWLSTGYLPPGAPHRKQLLEHAGAAVTLQMHDKPRGQAAALDADRPLYLQIEEQAVNAATRDPKVEPIRLEELAEVQITLYLLSPPEPCAPEGIDLALHGVAVTRGPRRGLVLPGVATAEGWDRDRLLDETCARAALPAGAWRQDGAQLQRFTAEKISE
jgi:hypothetical protein